MGEDQNAAAAREEGDKTEPVEESRCWIGSAGAGAVGLAVGKSQVEEPTPPFCLSICVHFQFLGVAEWVLSNMRCCSG